MRRGVVVVNINFLLLCTGSCEKGCLACYHVHTAMGGRLTVGLAFAKK